MPTTAPEKSRPGTSSKSFFGRKLYKDRQPEDRSDGYAASLNSTVAETQSISGSVAGSRSSRYSARGSFSSFDAEDHNPAVVAALNSNAGIITSIPFDSMPSDSKTPIPVDYLPKQDLKNANREPSPNHLAKSGSDFHQYPAWDSKSVSSYNMPQVGGPRPLPPSNITMTSSSTGDRGTRYQQWGRPGSSATNTSLTFASGTYASADAASTSRTSLDQASSHSSHSSSATRTSYFSDSNSSRTLTTSYSGGDRNSNYPSGFRQSNAQGSWQTSQQQSGVLLSPSMSSITSGEYTSRPKDDRIVDQLFLDLMQKRGWQNLPEQAKRQMLAYPAHKKWTLLSQDRLTELQGEQRRRTNARLTHGYDTGPNSVIGRADEEGSPEWYVKKVMDDTITSKQLGSLSVSLRTQPIE